MLFNALTNWVEKGVKPDHLVAQVNPTRTRKVCMYPNTPRYIGTGSTDDEANFVCQFNAQDDPALLKEEAGLLQGNGPLRGNHDIGRVPLPRMHDHLTNHDRGRATMHTTRRPDSMRRFLAATLAFALTACAVAPPRRRRRRCSSTARA